MNRLRAAILRVPTLHRWRVARWVDVDNGTDRVVWDLCAPPAPACTECHGAGGWLTGGGPHGDDPDMVDCWQCWAPLASARVPGWLDKAVTRRPPARSHYRGMVHDDPPF